MFFIVSIIILKLIFRIFHFSMYWFFPILIMINILKVYLGKGKYLAWLDQILLDFKWFQNFLLHCMVLETWVFNSKRLKFLYVYILMVVLNLSAIQGYFTLWNTSFEYFIDVINALVFILYCVYFDLRWRFINYYNLQLEGPWVYWNDVLSGVNKVLTIKVNNKIVENIPLALFSVPYSRLSKLSSPNTRFSSTYRGLLKDLIDFGAKNIKTIGKIGGGTTLVGIGQWEYHNRVRALEAARTYSASLDSNTYRIKMAEIRREMLDISKEKSSLISNKSLITTSEGKEFLQTLSKYETECDRAFWACAAKYIEIAVTEGAAIKSIMKAEDHFWSFKFVPGKGLGFVKFENPLTKAQDVLHQVKLSLSEDDLECLDSYLEHSTSQIREIGADMSQGMPFPRIMDGPSDSSPPTALSLGRISWIEIIFS